MATSFKNLLDNSNITVIAEHPCGVKIVEQNKDLSVTPSEAEKKYYMAKMDCKLRQALISINPNIAWTVQAGAMQWMLGNIQAQTGITGVGDAIGKMFQSKVTGEAPVKPIYTGEGILSLEPTYKHLIVENLQEWGGAITMNDGLFYASAGANISTQAMSSLSGAVLGGEGLFNTMCQGNGIVILESPYARDELVEIYLENDCLKVDGNYAICWSSGLQFTVERTTKTLVGSAASGEGLVNTYRGTGKVLLALY